MSNPYSQPTLSGYNATPPADDGSQVTANQLKWQTHIGKIGDPLKTFAQAIDANVLSAFGLIFGAQTLSKSGNYTVTVADRGAFIETTAALTITLPPAATAGSGFPIAIINTAAVAIVIDADGSELINGEASVYLGPFMALILSCTGTAWLGFSTNPGSQLKVKGADETVNNSVTLQDDDALQGYKVVADAFYEFNGILLVNNSSSHGLKMQLTFDNAPQIFIMGAEITADGGTHNADEISTANNVVSISGGVALDICHIYGMFQTHATLLADMKLQWAQNSAEVDDLTLNKGSFLRVTPIA